MTVKKENLLTVQDTGIKLEKHGKQYWGIDIPSDFYQLQETPQYWNKSGPYFVALGEVDAVKEKKNPSFLKQFH